MYPNEYTIYNWDRSRVPKKSKPSKDVEGLRSVEFVARQSVLLLGRHVDQGAGVIVLDHPKRAIGALLHIANALSNIEALGGLGSAFAIKYDAVDTHMLAMPLMKPLPSHCGKVFLPR